MKCKICNGSISRLFRNKVLQKHEVDYFRCDACGFVSTEDPYWLKEAYERPINICDTGILLRNEQLRDALSFLFYLTYKTKSRFLDYAGGYGVLTRMMRDNGYHYFWHDPHTKNLFAKGFEHVEENLPYDALTCCECFEHFVDPKEELRNMLGYSRNVYLTTTLIPENPPAPDEWDYYGFSHGQHVSFFTEASLRCLAEKYGLSVLTNGRQFHFIGDSPPRKTLFRLAWSPFVRLLPLFVRKLNGTLIHSDHILLRNNR